MDLFQCCHFRLNCHHRWNSRLVHNVSNISCKCVTAPKMLQPYLSWRHRLVWLWNQHIPQRVYVFVIHVRHCCATNTALVCNKHSTTIDQSMQSAAIVQVLPLHYNILHLLHTCDNCKKIINFIYSSVLQLADIEHKELFITIINVWKIHGT